MMKIILPVIGAALLAVLSIIPDQLFSLINTGYKASFDLNTFLVLYVSFLLALLAKNKKPLVGLSFLFALFIIPQFVHFLYFGTLPEPDQAFLLITEIDEVLESLATVWFEAVLCCLLVFLVYIAIYLLGLKIRRSCIKFPVAPPLLILILLFGVLPRKAFMADSIQYFYPDPQKYSLTNSLMLTSWILGHEVMRTLAGDKKTIDLQKVYPVQTVSRVIEAPEVNVIVVMGESVNPNHMSLFGYDRSTTPRMDHFKNSNGFKAKKIYSSAVTTKVSVPSFFNLKKYPGDTAILRRGETNLPKLAKENGFKTWFLSTQTSNLATFVNGPGVDNFSAKEDYWDEVEQNKDLVLLRLVEQVDFSAPNFVILHERGSHSPYDKFHPDEFDKYPEEGVSNDQHRVNSYDNSIYFTDYVHGEIIELIASKTSLPTIIIFTSDHGELLGENGIWGHSKLMLDAGVVPLISFCINWHDSECSVLTNEQYPVHYEVGRSIAKFLGYKVTYPNQENGIYYLNGSDITGRNGYVKLKFNSVTKELEETLTILQ